MVRAMSDAGQALVIVALAMIVIWGFLGLGIDLGHLRYMKRQLQKLADAAAFAGAMELSYCSGASNCSALTTAAEAAKELDYGAPATEIAPSQGRPHTLHVGMGSGLAAMAFLGQSLAHALGVSIDSTPGRFERYHHKGPR